MYIGLDISTSCTGVCVLDDNEKIVEILPIVLSKTKCQFAKADLVKEVLEELSSKYKIKEVFIEENLQRFRPGFSSAKTLLTLSRFNGIVSYICYKVFSKKPVYIPFSKARKQLGIKISNKSPLTTKEQIMFWVNNNYSLSWPTRKVTRGKNAGKTVLREECYDMADALVICKAGIVN